MGKMKQLWQEQRDARWQTHYDDYCRDNFGGREPVGVEITEAEEYALEQMEQEDEANGQFGVGA